MREVVPVCRSRTNRSFTPLVSPVTRLVAIEPNATNLPFPEREGEEDAPFPWLPELFFETRVVVPACRSRTKISFAAFVSPVTRLVDGESNATYLPFDEIAGSNDVSAACFSAELTETRVVVPACRSRTKISPALVSAVTR